MMSFPKSFSKLIPILSTNVNLSNGPVRKSEPKVDPIAAAVADKPSCSMS